MPAIGRGFIEPVQSPVLVSLTDGGDYTSFIAAVTGTGTIQLYYRLKGDTNWTTGQTRTNSGNITQSGLSAVWYEVYCTIKDEDAESAPSKILNIKILGDNDTTIETAIYALLSSSDDIALIVSNKIFPCIMPQSKSYPAIIWHQITGIRDSDMDGPEEPVEMRIQVDCKAPTLMTARTLSDAVRLTMNGYTGTINSRKIHGIFLEDENDIPVTKAGVEQVTIYGKSLDFKIIFNEQIEA